MTVRDKCNTCDGEGKVANTDNMEPWSQWAQLPVQSALAVVIGIVKPMTCPTCKGSGKATP